MYKIVALKEEILIKGYNFKKEPVLCGVLNNIDIIVPDSGSVRKKSNNNFKIIHNGREILQVLNMKNKPLVFFDLSKVSDEDIKKIYYKKMISNPLIITGSIAVFCGIGGLVIAAIGYTLGLTSVSGLGFIFNLIENIKANRVERDLVLKAVRISQTNNDFDEIISGLRI
ncbi:MAG: hypothetical protein PHV30_07520 [Candidatus Margulisbacteria bacterium]|nr:hypothetical protein [Candidatus Margulisiibacteriota bacterium]